MFLGGKDLTSAEFQTSVQSEHRGAYHVHAALRKKQNLKVQNRCNCLDFRGILVNGGRGAEESVLIGPEDVLIGPGKAPTSPEKVQFSRKDFAPIFSEIFGA